MTAEQIEEEYRKCIASPYYFFTTYMTVSMGGGETKKFTTLLTEEQFNHKFRTNATNSDASSVHLIKSNYGSNARNSK